MLSTPSSSATSSSGMIEFVHTLEKLKTQKRTGWVDRGIKLPESIADHMYRMAMIALVTPQSSSTPPLDIAKCVMMSIVHDLAEADVGDITPEEFSGVTKDQKHALEDAAMERIYGLLGGDTPQALRVKNLYEEYEARKTPEAIFVKDLDMFELVSQAVEYEASNGNRDLQVFFESTVPRILHPTVKAWASDMMDQRRQSWAERGWQDYKHVDVAPEKQTNGV